MMGMFNKTWQFDPINNGNLILKVLKRSSPEITELSSPSSCTVLNKETYTHG